MRAWRRLCELCRRQLCRLGWHEFDRFTRYEPSIVEKQCSRCGLVSKSHVDNRYLP